MRSSKRFRLQQRTELRVDLRVRRALRLASSSGHELVDAPVGELATARRCRPEVPSDRTSSCAPRDDVSPLDSEPTRLLRTETAADAVGRWLRHALVSTALSSLSGAGHEQKGHVGEYRARQLERRDAIEPGERIIRQDDVVLSPSAATNAPLLSTHSTSISRPPASMSSPHESESVARVPEVKKNV